ncbi:MAG: NAD(P)-dependent oxidoreductase [Desulfobacterales bacterium]
MGRAGHVKTHRLPRCYQSLKDKKILITGAAGFIGGAVYNRIAEYGLMPTATVLYPEEATAFHARNQEAVVLDLTSDAPWDTILEGIDIVFHIAAMFQEIGSGRQAYEKANHHGALKLAKAAERAGVERFVHCSTVGVYGDVKEVPATEAAPFNPMDEYHETKLAGELAILEWGRSLPSDGMVVVVNRPAMVYGPGDMRMLKLFKAILTQRFLMIGSGQTLAHLGYIEDQVDSFLLCAVAPRENVHLQAFNIASGDPMTLTMLCQQIADIGGVALSKHKIPIAPVWLASLLCEIVCKPLGIKPPLFRRRVGFFTHNRAFDYSKAQAKLGYRPVWESREGIAETIRWYRENNLL